MTVRRVTIITCDRCGDGREFADAKQARIQSYWHRSKGQDLCDRCFELRDGRDRAVSR